MNSKGRFISFCKDKSERFCLVDHEISGLHRIVFDFAFQDCFFYFLF